MSSRRSHDLDQLLHTTAIVHVAVGRDCARAVQAASHVAAENNTFNHT